MGILNYSLALMFALMTVPLTFVRPTKNMSLTSRVTIWVILALSSPAVLVATSEVAFGGAFDAIYHQAQSYILLNTFAFPLLVCIYIPIHALNLAIWTCV